MSRPIKSDPAECVMCLDCAASCPKTAITFGRQPTPRWHHEFDPSRRELIGGAATAAAGLVLFNTGFAQTKSNDLIRPPGVTNEAEFLAKCIRCDQCVQACGTHALHPVRNTQHALEVVMLRNFLTQLALLLCLSMVLLTSACSSAAQLATSPTPTGEAQRNPNVDMKPLVRDFLANLPVDWNLVSSQEVAKQSPFIVDVRQPDEYGKGFIAGAVNIPLRELARNLQSLPGLDKDIVVVCDTGHRGAVGMAILQMLGYKKAKTLDGGMQSWQAAKLPIVSAPIPQRPFGQTPNVSPQVQAMLDYYLLHTLPYDWGVIDAAGLIVDQKTPPSSAGEAQPETYDQGASLIVDVDPPAEYAKSTLTDYQHAINISLRELPNALDQMPLQETIGWA